MQKATVLGSTRPTSSLMGAAIPHPDDLHSKQRSVRCNVLTISDTRTPQTDKSGGFLQQALADDGHQVLDYQLLPDQPESIKSYLRELAQSEQVEAVICSGGTGIALRDVTYDVVSRLLDKELTGFGEIFRMLSYSEIGSRAIASRATAGIYKKLLIFALPGSLNAVRLATERLILPELRHLVHLVRSEI